MTVFVATTVLDRELYDETLAATVLRVHPRREALTADGAKMFRLDARHSLNKWAQLENIVCQWRRFEEMAGLPGPWTYTATRTTLYKDL
jgi:hypothetical protein